jgi:hypothetical protein
MRFFGRGVVYSDGDGVGSFDHSRIDILAPAPPEHRKPIRLSCFGVDRPAGGGDEQRPQPWCVAQHRVKPNDDGPVQAGPAI